MIGCQLRTVLTIAAVFILVRFVFDALTSPWNYWAEVLLMLLLLALAWCGLAASLWRRWTAGPAVLTLPNPWPGIRCLQILLAVACGGLGAYLATTPPMTPALAIAPRDRRPETRANALARLLAAWLYDEPVRTDVYANEMAPEAVLARLIAALLCASFALLLAAAAAFSRIRFTHSGVFGPSGYIGWQDVAAHRWDGEGGLELTLIPRRPLAFFAPMPWAVPDDQKAKAEEVLLQHVSPESTAAPSLA